MDWAQILVIILAIFLAIFLLLGIILTILLIKVTKQIKDVTETASRAAHGFESLIDGANKIASPAIIAKTVADLVKKMKTHERKRRTE